jgi:hypothetical protein
MKGIRIGRYSSEIHYWQTSIPEQIVKHVGKKEINKDILIIVAKEINTGRQTRKKIEKQVRRSGDE